MLIKNKKQLAISQSRKQLLQIIEAGIEAVLPLNIMPKVIGFDKRNRILKIKDKKFKLGKGRIFVIGGGKAAGLMAESLEGILGINNITAGVVNCVRSGYKTKKIEVNQANHPIPDKKGLKGVKQILGLRQKFMINENDLVICLISGGGSALLPYPRRGISLADKQKTTKLLLKSGAEIHEMNIVRKHLSAIKGGQLAEYFSPARIISLIISDVVGNDLDTIASGPTVIDKSSWQDAYKVLKKYKLLNKVSPKVVKLIKQGIQGQLTETPDRLNKTYNYIIADNLCALKGMAKKAKQLKLKPKIVTHKLTGDASRMAKKIAGEIKAGKHKANLIILGGETTTALPATHGKGGRNQHFGVITLMALKNYSKNWTMASLSTDGSDFLSGVAGVMVDYNSLTRLDKKKINIKPYIKNFDSYNLFKKSNEHLIKMDDTGTNVGDAVIYILA